MNNNNQFMSSSMIEMIEETLRQIDKQEIVAALSPAEAKHMKTHTDALTESVNEIKQRFPVPAALDPSDPETLNFAMGVLTHTSCIGDLINQMRQSARRTAYKHSVRSIYRRRRCD